MRILIIAIAILIGGCGSLQEKRTSFMGDCLEVASVLDCTAVDYYNFENVLNQVVARRHLEGAISDSEKQRYKSIADRTNEIVDEAWGLGNLDDIKNAKDDLDKARISLNIAETILEELANDN